MNELCLNGKNKAITFVKETYLSGERYYEFMEMDMQDNSFKFPSKINVEGICSNETIGLHTIKFSFYNEYKKRDSDAELIFSWQPFSLGSCISKIYMTTLNIDSVPIILNAIDEESLEKVLDFFDESTPINISNNCPFCGKGSYYYGMMGHNCDNKQCKYYS